MTNPDLGSLMGSYNACLEEIDRLRTPGYTTGVVLICRAFWSGYRRPGSG